jgi:hypothetical protein
MSSEFNRNVTVQARDALRPNLLATWPALAVLQAKTGRRIPLLTLTRRGSPGGRRCAMARTHFPPRAG